MNNEDRRKLKDAFNQWAESMPNPDEPMLGFVGTPLLSPRAVAREVENKTAFGRDFLEILEYGVEREGLDKVIARLTRRTPPQP